MYKSKVFFKKYYKIILFSCSIALFLLSAILLTDGIVSYTKELSAWSSHTSAPIDLGNNTYEIHTAEQLAGLAKSVNSGVSYSGKIIELKANIDMSGTGYNSSGLSWTPIGTSSSPFKGTFNGNGCHIDGIKINSTGTYIGLFGVIDGAKINKVSLKGTVHQSDVNSTSSYVGGLVGYCKASTISNCIINVTASGAYCVGGIVGIVATSSTIQNCLNYANVYGYTNNTCYVGGIVGYGYGKLTNCHNYASVYSLSAKKDASETTFYKGLTTNYAGGVVGNSYGTINSCSSAGEVVVGCTAELDYDARQDYESTNNAGGFGSKRCYISAYGYGGGIAGKTNSSITNSYSIGSRVYVPRGTWTQSGSYGGGIAGYTTSSISNCYTTCVVTCNSFSFTSSNAGSQTIGSSSVSFTHTTYKVQDHYQDPIAGYTASSISNCYYTPAMKYKGISTYVTQKINGKDSLEVCYYPTEGLYGQHAGGSYVYGFFSSSASGTQYHNSTEYFIYSEGTTGALWWKKSVVKKFFNYNSRVSSRSSTQYVASFYITSLKVYIDGDYDSEENKDGILVTSITLDKTCSITYNGTKKSSTDDVYNSLDKNVWSKSSNINGGKPYLKSQYWE